MRLIIKHLNEDSHSYHFVTQWLSSMKNPQTWSFNSWNISCPSSSSKLSGLANMIEYFSDAMPSRMISVKPADRSAARMPSSSALLIWSEMSDFSGITTTATLQLWKNFPNHAILEESPRKTVRLGKLHSCRNQWAAQWTGRGRGEKIWGMIAAGLESHPKIQFYSLQILYFPRSHRQKSGADS